MKLTVQQRPDDSGFITSWSATFEAPGGTLGRSTDNHLTLPDPKRNICRIQAALRISDDACYLVNLSSMSHVSINGRTILRDQEVPLSPGDELVVGSYTLKAEDPLAPTSTDSVALAGGFATLTAAQSASTLTEPDPLLESPLLDLTTAEPEAAPPRTNPIPNIQPPQTPAVASPPAAAETVAATKGQPDISPSAPIESDHTPTIDPIETTTAAAPFAKDTPDTSGMSSTTEAFPESTSTANPFASDNAEANPDLSDNEPLAETSSGDTSNIDVFSDLFGPGTLPVGSVPDVSAHPFDMESAQNRNPEDPLRHLPRGDANVSGPLRDPLDLLDSHEGDDVHNVFSDQTPSTLPSHDPLAPHRLDPVSETLRTKQDHDNEGWAARDHLREYGGYLRPARVQQPTTKPDDNDQKPDTPRRK